MARIEDVEFRLDTLYKKIERINSTATEVEATPTDDKLQSLLKVMTVNLDDLHEEFEKLTIKLAQLYSKSEPRKETDTLKTTFSKFEKLFFNAKAVVMKNVPEDQLSGTPVPMLSTSFSNAQTVVSIPLPKLKLLSFGGDLMEWQAFYDLFLSTVHSQEHIPEVQKFMYLKAQLTGEPQSLLSSIPTTAANYLNAWGLITKRYNNPVRLTNAYLEALIDLPICTKDPVQLRAFNTSLVKYTGGLRALGHNVEQWSVPLIFLLRRKLSPQIREKWEIQALELVICTLTDFVSFIDDQVTLNENTQLGIVDNKVNKRPSNKLNPNSSHGNQSATSYVTSVQPAQKRLCPCKVTHLLTKCHKYQKMPVGTRFKFVKSKGYCIRCLNGDHFSRDCTQSVTCQFCNGTHHALLCFKNEMNKLSLAEVELPKSNSGSQSMNSMNKPELNADVTNSNVTTMQASTRSTGSLVILSTAKAIVKDAKGIGQYVKILIDTASQGTFITQGCVKRLGLLQKSNNTPLFGLGHLKAGTSKGIVSFNIKSTINSINFDIEALVVEHIAQCSKLPVGLIDWPHLKHLQLADDSFHSDQPIDILLGSEWYARVVVGAPIVGPEGAPDAMNTVFGYSLLGRVNLEPQRVNVFCSTLDSIDITLRKFWEMEEIPSDFTSLANDDDRECEQHFRENVSRFEGKYILKLPFKRSDMQLGNSYSLARRRFETLERKLEKSPVLREKYNEFMMDYAEQGHMIRVGNPPRNGSYYIPHHCIYREDDNLSRFRVVFDCSMKTTNGVSLNDILHVGPKLQLSIVDILTCFRIHDVCVVADVRQMYRGIGIHPSQFDFQRIFWRFSKNDPLDEYCLTTVTYGNTAAPYLAIRTLHQLISDEGRDFPAASRAIRENTFMDDICTSVPSLESAKQLQCELTALLGRAKFVLKKWISNRVELLSDLPVSDCVINPEIFSFLHDVDPGTAILGLAWNPVKDAFSFRVNSIDGSITKRTILSQLARLYDPLGFLSPVIFYGKWLIQHLWYLGVDWDTPPPEDVIEKWKQFQNELPLLSSFEIPRCFELDSAVDVQLHGFSDSSEKGYCGVVYVRVVHENGRVSTTLLIAKSKVAPLQKITLPRLELCGAVLVSKLLDFAKNLLKDRFEISSVTAWCDSTVTLHWIKSTAHKWKTFVANRVSQIHVRLSPDQFRYVPTASNPSDIGSRGVLPRSFLENSMWLTGPEWLKLSAENWPSHPDVVTREDVESEARVINLLTEITPQSKLNWMLKFSSLSKLKRTMAYWIRYFQHLRNPKDHPFRIGGPKTEELNRATIRLVMLVQRESFGEDIRRLSKGQPLSARLRKLNPFLDTDGLLRVGGRLEKAPLTFNRKHQMLIPKTHHFTNLLIAHVHEIYLHAGPMHVHSIIQTEFWLINAREIIRNRLSKCVKCFRTKPREAEQLMGQLPSSRLESICPFNVTGVDYGGPFHIKLGRVRNAKLYKGYMCLFICFSTRAIHLELVSDLSTDSFLAALRRFIARRGGVTEIHSDCGTNFVGSRRKLEAWQAVVSSDDYNKVADRLTSERGIAWKFNPPGSPHLGGLWEAAIKSVKKHLVRVIGNQILTYEELYTVLVQIEAVVNSRPITPISSSPTDVEALTPGHFLMQRAVVTVPEPPANARSAIDLNHRWKLTQQLVRSFWDRWQRDYLSTLQIRSKWTKKTNNLQIGDVVIMKEPNLPPCQWRLARVVNVFPGDDGMVRVAEVRNGQGTYSRTVQKLCPLPKIE